MFEASVGRSFSSDIAIDDVQMFDGACPDPGDCDFETGECTWVNVLTNSNQDEFDWIRSSFTPSKGTGPKKDHSTNSNKGHFMYIESSYPRKYGDKARLESEVFVPTTGQCMQFWYHMNGTHINKLSVFLKVVEQSESRILTLSQHQGDQWLQGQVPIKSDKPYVVSVSIDSKYYG